MSFARPLHPNQESKASQNQAGGTPPAPYFDSSPTRPIHPTSNQAQPIPMGSVPIRKTPDQAAEGDSVDLPQEPDRRIIYETDSQSIYNLSYACLVIPRFPSHYLIGDLAVRLSEWVPHLSIAYGWRLEFISVNPDFLQWIVNVPPTTAPGYLMRILRQHTSEKIFAEFPRIRNENPSNDFWAPGYVLIGGSNPHPEQLVRDFIQQTRQRQGIS